MGLPPAHAKTMGEILNPDSRRWLSQFFAGILDKNEKSGTVLATWLWADPKSQICIKAFMALKGHA